MKHRVVFILTIVIISMYGCCFINEDTDEYSSEDETSIESSSVFSDESITGSDVFSNNGESESSSDDNEKMLFCEDEDINSLLQENVIINDCEKIEYLKWVDEEATIFRVAIERTEPSDLEYDHIRDYFFIKSDKVQVLEVNYPSKQDLGADRYPWNACSFDAELVDVTFDGNKDLLIFLGYSGTHGDLTYCAYIYEEGQYRYERTFEDISNYSINRDSKVIEGVIHEGPYHVETEYEFIDGKFVQTKAVKVENE